MHAIRIPVVVLSMLVGLSALVDAADVVQMKDGTLHSGAITRVEPGAIVIHIEKGDVKADIPLPMADVARVQLDKPAAFDTGVAALRNRQYTQAVTALKPVSDRYAGLPGVTWAQDAISQLADAYAGLKDLANVRATFERMKKLYPNMVGSEVKSARLLYEEKQYAPAIETLNKFVDPLLKKEALTEEQELAVGEALVLRGDSQLALKERENALDSYLLVVALFDVDPDRAIDAKYKAGQIYEQSGNVKRARESYEEVTREGGKSSYTTEAQKRLAELKPKAG